jgi:Protein of unknown function (DUF1566)
MLIQRIPLAVTGLVLLLGTLSLSGCGGGDDAAIAQGVATDVSGITPNWDKKLLAAQRFVVLSGFNGQAVRDNETGLVWEQSPAMTTHFWSDARNQCPIRETGGRKGWRLPSVHELESLIDPSVAQPGPTLPPGHPFTNLPFTNNILGAEYWSASTVADSPASAWFVDFSIAGVGTSSKPSTFRVWCVRGGNNADAY